MLPMSVVQLQGLTDVARAITDPRRAMDDALVNLLDALCGVLGVDAARLLLEPDGRSAGVDLARPARAATTSDRTGATLTAPMVASDGRTLGSLTVTDRRGTRSAFADDDQAVLTFVATLTSTLLEARRQADAERSVRGRLGRGRQRVKAVLDTMPTGIVALDSSGRYVYANPMAAQLTRRAAADILTSHAADASWRTLDVDGTDRERDVSPVLRALDGETVVGEVVGLRFDDGEIAWLIIHASPIVEDDGSISGAVAGFVDLTERVELQRRLAASEARLRQSERVTGVGSWELDLGTQQVASSVALHELLGLEPEDRFDLSRYLELVHPDDRGELERGLAGTAERAVALSTRIRVRRTDDAERVIAVVGEPSFDLDGSVRSIVGTLRDITDEVAEQERLRRAQRLESIGRLAGGLAHDLNNFLTVLAGHAELLSETATAQQADSVTAIVRATDRAAALTRQLLEVGRREVMRPTTFDLNALLERQRPTIRQILPGAVDLHWETAATLPPVEMDPTKFEQVLLNLVLNASDAVGVSGAVTIRTSVAGRFVCASVADTGPGMPPDVLARAFEPFFSTKARDRGTGLGLSTARGIMEQSGGLLELESHAGFGTTVRILLPMSDGPVEEDAVRPAAVDLGLTGTVLVAEDDEQVRELAVAALRRAGCTVLVAVDGPDAVRVATEHPGRIDLLVTDVSMPGFGGHRTAEEVVRLYPRVRVVYISGYAERSPVLRELGSDDIDLLAKPFTVSDLLTKAAVAMSRQSTR